MSLLDWLQFAFGGFLFVLITVLASWGAFFVLPSVFFLAWVIKMHRTEAKSTPTETSKPPAASIERADE